jgi:hypothetical protein
MNYDVLLERYLTFLLEGKQASNEAEQEFFEKVLALTKEHLHVRTEERLAYN